MERGITPDTLDLIDIYHIYCIFHNIDKAKYGTAPGPSQRPVEVRFSAPGWLRRSVFLVAI
jgi:hypothetical protein